jgi:hypothetical protein
VGGSVIYPSLYLKKFYQPIHQAKSNLKIWFVGSICPYSRVQTTNTWATKKKVPI